MKTVHAFCNSLLIGCIWICVVHAQTVEQIWPPDSAGALGDIVIYDDNTIVAFGANDAILQSDDGGTTWNTVRWRNSELNFYRAVRSGDHIWVLALTALEKYQQFPERADIQLLEYHPRTHALSVRPLPATSHLVIDAYTEASDDTLYLLAQDDSGAATLARTTDNANTWDTIPLPTTSHGVIDASFFCRDRDHIGIFMRNENQGISLYLTEDGGGSWRQCDNLSVDYSRHYNASYLAGSGARWTRDNAIILTIRNQRTYPEKYYFAVSKDNGRSWEQRALRPHDPIMLIASDSNTVCYSDFLRNIYLSEDGCRTFRLVAEGSAKKTGQYGDYLSGHQDDWCTGLSMDDRGRIAACDRRGNLGYSSDNGATWQVVRRHLLELHNFNMLDDLRGMLEARDIRTNQRNLYATRDGARNWTEIMDLDSAGFAGLRHHTPTLSFAVPTRTRADSTAVLRSTDGGSTWTTVARDDPPSSKYSFIATEADSSFVAVLTDSRILLSTDAGETWRRLSLPAAGYLYWLGRSGLGWIWGDDGLYLSELSLRYGFWNSQYKILDWDGSPLAVQVFSDLEACVVGCRKTFRTTTGGELWSDADSYDCWAYRAWSVRDGRGAKCHPVEGLKGRYYWHPAPVYTTMDHWMTERLSAFWYTADDYMSGHYRWCAPPSSSSQYILTDHSIFKVNFDGVSQTTNRPQPSSSVFIESPSPHPAKAGTSMEIRVTVPEALDCPVLTVCAITGECVATVPFSARTENQVEFRWHTADIVPGAYILRASVGSVTAIRIVIVQ